jgi:hypothetical protein
MSNKFALISAETRDGAARAQQKLPAGSGEAESS